MGLSENIQPGVTAWFKQHCQPYLSDGYRVALVLSGDRQWALSFIDSLATNPDKRATLTVSSVLNGALPAEKATTQLGNEYQQVVFDAHDGIDVDALGAVSGTLRAGGIFVLLVPAVGSWQDSNNSLFLQRFVNLSRLHQSVFFVEQGKALPAPEHTSMPSPAARVCEQPYATVDQKQVVEKIIEVFTQGKNIPLVITSDRGRGKSSALGITAAKLLQQGIHNIIITAPRLVTSKPLFDHAARLLPGAEMSKGELSFQQGKITYWAGDALLEQQPNADLVLVDEAAAIPLSMLQKLLKKYDNIVFSSTIHGYEGTGRGFALKFKAMLDADKPGWLSLGMQLPVRWRENDPVEHWVNRLLCLDAELAEIPRSTNIEQCEVKQLQPSELVDDEAKLSTLFALLVYAHYRTRPSDLQYLLDDNNIRIYSLEHNNHIVAALVINVEGGFTDELSSAIYRGERRPAGHLLAQTLTFHAGCEQAATSGYARVMRIAVHPGLQGRGLGSYFLQKVVEQEKTCQVDMIGTSFAASSELLRFWQRAGFELLRMGFTRDHVSGTHSAVMAIPVTDKGLSIFNDVKQRFAHGLQAWLAEPLQDLPGDMKRYLESLQQPAGTELTEQDWQDIEAFVTTHRGYEACMTAVHKLVSSNLQLLVELEASSREIIQARVVQRNSWDETVRVCQLSGKKQALQFLRSAIGKLVKKLK